MLNTRDALHVHANDPALPWREVRDLLEWLDDDAGALH